MDEPLWVSLKKVWEFECRNVDRTAAIMRFFSGFVEAYSMQITALSKETREAIRAISNLSKALDKK